jgi:hypothetical protein
MKLNAMWTAALVGCLAASAVLAESPRATSLGTAEAERFVGSWVLNFNALGQDRQLGLTVTDVDGFLGATLDSSDQPEPRALETIVKLDNGVDFQFEMPFGDQRLRMHLELVESAGQITGVLREQNNIFSTQVTGEPGELTVDESKRASRTDSRAVLAGNKKVTVTFGNLSVGGEDFAKLANVKDGEVFRFVGSRATKLFTDADLAFGDTIIKTANVAPNYPGVYSLWLKRVGDGWALVVNTQPDIWGTQHEAAYDVADIPLQATKSDKAQQEFLITLEANGDSGTMRLAWGEAAWTAAFSLAQ